MLGRLAKWLRLLGYDTAYAKNVDDAVVLDLAIQEERIILTRDTLLIRRKRCRNYIFVRSDHWREQLQQVYVEAHLSVESALTICPVCNYPLRLENRESLRPVVPPYVYQTQKTFSRCDRCARIYWQASHVQRIIEELRTLPKES
ncbi:MAG: hypothetical protein C4520_14850 [Candidatus Abyssobacteria bacterium SURF_5]|uniref:Mut7-C RNAse domain-containing protein n=1 Tax=Abyssobacteria bacterium (strain SURF_5) TaxID=2093360 RepID=A0A3A4NIM0_ABYX5|nr:MAG: hypothetical protein C4520_14850 [Candidatus Abyssubacteria bacterium SURF_5]